jgi:hypothetical protein
MARASAKDEDDGEEEEEDDDDAPKPKKRKVAVDKEDKPKLTVKTKSGTNCCARRLAARTCARVFVHVHVVGPRVRECRKLPGGSAHR